MDCPTVRQWLDLHPPGSSGVEAGAVEVREHLSECPLCREFANDIWEFDRRVSTILEEVPVPEGLHERITRQLQLAVPRGKSPSSAVPRMRKMLVGLSLSVMLVIGGLYWVMQPVQFTTDRLGDSAAEVLLGNRSQPAAFSGRFPAEVEDPRWQRAITSGPVGWDLDGKPGHDAAAFRVTIPSLRFRGWLVMIPVSRVNDAPDSTEPVRLRYSQSIAWRDQKFVYICLAEQGNIESLLDQWGAA